MNGSRSAAVILAGFVLGAIAPGARGGERPVSNQWALVDEDRTGSRTSAGLFYVPALKKVVLTGGNVPAEVPYAQALDTGSLTWTALGLCLERGRSTF